MTDDADPKDDTDVSEEATGRPSATKGETGNIIDDLHPEYQGQEPVGREKVKTFAKNAGTWFRKVFGSLFSGLKAVFSDPLICVRKLDGLLEWTRASFSAEWFDIMSRWAVKSGHVGLVTSAVVGLLFVITVAVRTTTLAPIFGGLGFILLLIVVQYTAEKFINAGVTLINSSPSVLTSRAFLQCIALIAEVGGLLFLIRCIVVAFKLKILAPFWMGLGTAVLCDSIAFVAIHPALANTSISERASAGEEAIGILSFFVKTFMRLVPIAFGTGVVVGVLALLGATLKLMVSSGTGLSAGIGQSMASVQIIIWSALLPLVAYVSFAVFCLLVDLLRAVLSLNKNGR
ncbi:MAG: hypothetical protein E4H02_03380 [Lentisphaerales bacterium]|nr:MAG: hypothetical protein E4H02_03380 [Lentisphaerales bacterium]